MKEGINYELKDGKITVATYQMLTDEIFCKKLLNMNLQMENFKMQKDFSTSEIKTGEETITKAKANIVQMEQNIEAVSQDVLKAYEFLKSIHREDLVTKIESEVAKKKAEVEAQIAQQMQGMPQQ